jgi:spermidine synthase
MGPVTADREQTAGSRRRFVMIAIGVFISGAVLLGMEIAASRVVAPYFGNSLFVWGALIGVVLTGLMIGYWVGGVLADRFPPERLLVGTMTLGALGVLGIPLLDGPVLELVVEWDPGARLNPLIAAIILFGPASVVMAATTPIAVRLVATSLRTLGRTSGGLFSLSTGGSIVGTLATAFFLIPEFGLDQLLAIGGATLAAAVVAIAISERFWWGTGVGAAVLAIGVVAAIALAPEEGRRLSATEAANWSPVARQRETPSEPLQQAAQALDAVYAKDSQYHRILVTEDGANRYLRFDNSYQSGMKIDDPYTTVFGYEDAMHVGLAYRPSTKRVLVVGLGGGSIPKRIWRDFPGITVDTVEIDKEVVNVARRFFALPDDPRLRTHVDDGRQWLLKNDEERFDIIFIDAFYSDSIPAHLATQEFLALAKSRLKLGGLIVTNVIGAMRGEQSKLFRSMHRTYRSQFQTVEAHPVDDTPGAQDDDEIRNIILVATDSPTSDPAFLMERWREIRREHPGTPELDTQLSTRWAEPVPIDDVPTLTDDYAPTDALLLVL